MKKLLNCVVAFFAVFFCNVTIDEKDHRRFIARIDQDIHREIRREMRKRREMVS